MLELWQFWLSKTWSVIYQVTGSISAVSGATASAQVDQLAVSVPWYLKPFVTVAAPAGVTHTVAAFVSQDASFTGAGSMVRGIESVLARTEANAELVDWAIARGVSGNVQSASATTSVSGSVEDVEALEMLLGIHL